jgi:hypothetical protein
MKHHIKKARYVWLVSFTLFFINYSVAQKKDIGDSITNHEDSIALSLLVKYFPNDSIANQELIIDGKKNKIKKYYAYLSFSLTLNKSKKIRIINFGTYAEHNPHFILIMKLSNNIISRSSMLGKEKLEKDLSSLGLFFNSLSVTEKYKLEMLDIFLQTRRGKLITDKYLH